MTKILEQAIAKARELSDEEQDAVGAVLLSLTDDLPSRMDELDDESRSAIRHGRAQARRGEFAPNEEIQFLWKRYGL